MATYGAECWTLNKYITKRLAAFEIKILNAMFWGVKLNENWSKSYNKELMQLFGNSGIILIVGRSQFNCVYHVNRMDSKRKICRVLNNNHQGSRLM
jgi:hypothetical protein